MQRFPSFSHSWYLISFRLHSFPLFFGFHCQSEKIISQKRKRTSWLFAENWKQRFANWFSIHNLIFTSHTSHEREFYRCFLIPLFLSICCMFSFRQLCDRRFPSAFCDSLSCFYDVSIKKCSIIDRNSRKLISFYSVLTKTIGCLMQECEIILEYFVVIQILHISSDLTFHTFFHVFDDCACAVCILALMFY